MANAVWPASLPRGPKLGHQETPPRPVVRTQMDVGPAKQRPRSTADATKIDSVTLYFTRNQVATFDAFFRETLGFGSEAFEWTHPRTGNLVDARFVDTPRYSSLAPRQDGSEKYKVEFTLELLPGTEQVTPAPPPPPPDPPPEDGIYLAPAATEIAVGYEAMWVATFDEPDNAPPDPDDDGSIYVALPASNDDLNNAILDRQPADTSMQIVTIVSVDSLPITGGGA